MRNMPDFYDCVRVCVWAINFTIPTFVWCNNFCLNCKTFLAQKTINWVGIKNVYRSWSGQMRQPATASAASAFISIININRVKAKKERQPVNTVPKLKHSFVTITKNFIENNWISRGTQFKNIFFYFETKVYIYKNIYVVLIDENRQLPSLGRIISLYYIQIIYVFIIYRI